MKCSLLSALLCLVAGKDDGFDYPNDVSSMSHGEYAKMIKEEAFAYQPAEEWNQGDLGVISNNLRINTNQPPRTPKFTKEGFKKMKIRADIFEPVGEQAPVGRSHKMRSPHAPLRSTHRHTSARTDEAVPGVAQGRRGEGDQHHGLLK
jgi:hypothetical protein